MKVIKVKFVGFWKDFDPHTTLVYQFLKKHYDVQIVEDADYIICSMYGEPYEYCQYPQIRIMYSGENYVPDFNLVDYAICPYPLDFLDRCFYKPVCIYHIERCMALQNKERNYTEEVLESKDFFANFIAGHESEYSIRGDFFKKLCEYKRVESPGTYLNNMISKEKISFLDGSKTDFQRRCKFTLCFESTAHEGFVTEKITDAFYSDTIPVYYGSSTATEIFNSKAFINCSDYPSFDAVIEKIKELDQDDQKYLEMLRQPVFVDEKFPEKVFTGMENFLVSIFEQPLEKAYRRSRVYEPKRHDEYLAKAQLPKEYSTRELIVQLKRRVIDRIKTR